MTDYDAPASRPASDSGAPFVAAFREKAAALLPSLAAAAALLYLLAFPVPALASAREGLLLWYHSVLPTLFPFMLLCGIMLRFGLADRAVSLIYHPLRLLFGCSRGGAFAIVTGLLCGLPMGAAVTADLLRRKKISPAEGRFLFGFVNNVSPAFLVSYVASEQLGMERWRYLILFNVLGSAVLYGLLTSFSFRRENALWREDTPPASEAEEKSPGAFALLDDCIDKAATATVRLGVWIMVFSIVSGALSSLPGTGSLLPLLLTSCVEITGGIRRIAASPLPFPARYVIIHALAAFGGVSALVQTAQTASMEAASLLSYIKSRVACTLLSSLVSVVTGLFCLLFL